MTVKHLLLFVGTDDRTIQSPTLHHNVQFEVGRESPVERIDLSWR